MLKLADIYYGTKGILSRVAVTANNIHQIFTEQTLESLLEEENVDIGFFYEGERAWGGDSGYQFISLPTHLDMSDINLSTYYHQVSYYA